MHFVVTVLVDGKTKPEDIEAVVEEMLEPFNEQLEVEVHEEQCWCIGSIAENESKKSMRWADRLDAKRIELLGNENFDELWSQFMESMRKQLAHLIETHPQRLSPNPSCETCDGTGVYETTNNPDSFWDWWVIGGRWDGWIYGKEHQEKSSDENGFNFGEEHHTVKNNSRPVCEIPLGEDGEWFYPFAIITPDGDLHTGGYHGGKEWLDEVEQIYSENPDCIAVTVDCHS
jgi:hypothetical protein